MIPKTDEALKQFAQAVLYAHKPYGLKPSIENLKVWHDRLHDLPLGRVQTALDRHVADQPGKLPTPDGIRTTIVGDERDPTERLFDMVAEQAARIAELERRMGVAAEAAPVKPIRRKAQKRKLVAMPAQLALSFEFENAGAPAD